MLTYKTVTVYEKDIGDNLIAMYYVVNTVTKRVQSTWTKSIDAYRTCKQLNDWVNKGVI